MQDFGDLNVHHADWLTHSRWPDRTEKNSTLIFLSENVFGFLTILVRSLNMIHISLAFYTFYLLNSVSAEFPRSSKGDASHHLLGLLSLFNGAAQYLSHMSILNNISMTHKMVKAVTDLDSSTASSPDCIPVVLENKYETLRLKKTCFSDCWYVLHVVFMVKKVEERFVTKMYKPLVAFLFQVKLFRRLRITGFLINLIKVHSLRGRTTPTKHGFTRKWNIMKFIYQIWL